MMTFMMRNIDLRLTRNKSDCEQNFSHGDDDLLGNLSERMGLVLTFDILSCVHDFLYTYSCIVLSVEWMDCPRDNSFCFF